MKWQKLDQNGDVPVARSSHSITAWGDKLICFGGEHISRTPVGSEVYLYDIPTSSWSRVEASGTPPTPRIAHAAALIGPLLYIFGGRSGVDMGEGALNDLHTFNVQTNTWEQVSFSGAAPAARSFHTMAVVGHKLFVFGGCGQQARLNDLHCFDTNTNTWKELPSSSSVAPRGGSFLSTTEGGNKLCVVGGFCGKELNDLHMFDLQSNTWECPRCCEAQSALTARSVFGGTSHNCQASPGCNWHQGLVAFGGEVDPSEIGHSGAGQFSQDVFAFLGEKGWQRVQAEGEAPCARGWFASGSTADGSGLVVHGGLNDTNERLGDLWLLQLH